MQLTSLGNAYRQLPKSRRSSTPTSPVRIPLAIMQNTVKKYQLWQCSLSLQNIPARPRRAHSRHIPTLWYSSDFRAFSYKYQIAIFQRPARSETPAPIFRRGRRMATCRYGMCWVWNSRGYWCLLWCFHVSFGAWVNERPSSR